MDAGRDVTVGPDLTSRTEVELPAGARPGRATLRLRDRRGHGTHLDLVIT